jgi:hypothetical protein
MPVELPTASGAPSSPTGMGGHQVADSEAILLALMNFSSSTLKMNVVYMYAAGFYT